MTAARANATPWNVLWLSFSTITFQASPLPLPGPVSRGFRVGVGVSTVIARAVMPSRVALSTLRERRDQRLRHDLQRPPRELARPSQARERLLLVEPFLLHQEALRPLDRLPRGERLGERGGLVAERGQLVVAGLRRPRSEEH